MRMTLILAALVLMAATARADDAAMQGIGGAMQPMKEHPSVVMERMDVHIGLWQKHAEVDCRFTFRNTGPATTVRMGFPESSYYQEYRKHPVGFTRFATWVDGRRVRAVVAGMKWVRPEGHWNRWRVKRVSFAANQTREVRVSYRAPNGVYHPFDAGMFTYVVSSGASWRGPIGRVRVRVDGHYNPAHDWLDVPPQTFRRVGNTSFEWVAEDLNPTEDDDVNLGYYPEYTGFQVSTDREAEYTEAPAYLSQGHLWGPASALGNWLNAEAQRESGNLTLIKGSHRVTLRPGSDEAQTDGGLLKLPGKAHLEHGYLYAPLAPLARALGGEVDFDPEHRVVSMTMPSYEALLARFGHPQADPVFRSFPAGYDLPAVTPEASPIAAGDFDGDGKGDAAFVLRKGDLVGVGVEQVTRSWSDCKFTWLPENPVSESYTPTILLRTRPPGPVEYFADEGLTPARFELKREGIEVIRLEQAARVYYWDVQGRTYRYLQTAD